MAYDSYVWYDGDKKMKKNIHTIIKIWKHTVCVLEDDEHWPYRTATHVTYCTHNCGNMESQPLNNAPLNPQRTP